MRKLAECGWATTADEVIAGIDLRGHRAVVTGGTSGIGSETVRVLAAAGAEVTFTGRNMDAGARVLAEILDRHPEANVRLQELDLADGDSVTAFVRDWVGPLHLLINNAGTAMPTRALTPAGHEVQFASNHLGHFLLTTGLHPALAAGAKDAGGLAGPLGHARVVVLSSRAHLSGPVDFDDINFERREYELLVGYGQSKTATTLFAVEAARRWARDGITVNAVNPGSIQETQLARHHSASVKASIETRKRRGVKSVGQGAATTVLVATSPELRTVTGRYFEDCHEAAVIGPEVPDIPGAQGGVAWFAVHPDLARQLWEVSEQLTG